jgi:hypothetical protein
MQTAAVRERLGRVRLIDPAMYLLGLVPALSLLFADGVAVDAEPSTEAATPAASATAPADAPSSRPQQPRWKGTGLLATTGVLGGASLAVTITRSVLLKKNCPLSGTGAARCSYDFGSDIGLAATSWSLNLATVGFAAGSGVMLGRYHAWKDAGENRERRLKVINATGGALVGVGIGGVATSIALAFVLPARCLDKELGGSDPLAGDRCLLKAFPAWTMTNWASFAMISSGSGMLAYGSVYGRNRERPTANVRVAPFAGRTYAGVGLGGQF